jgi:integrase
MTKEDCIRRIIHKDGSESWHYEVRLRGFNVRGTCLTKTEAKAKRDQTRTDILRGAYLHTAEAQRALVGDLIDKFVEHCLHRYGSYKGKMKAHLDWWKQELGKIRLSNLTPARIIECQNKLHGGVTYRNTPRSGATVNRYCASLSSVFRHGVKMGWMQSNPMIRVSKLKEGPSRNRFLSREEIDRLFIACENSPNPNLLPVVKIAALTGMRLGEIIGLNLGAIDFSRKIITLEQTKNGDKRLIPISPVLEEVLKGCLVAGASPDEYVFKTRRVNTKNRIGMIRTAFAKALEESGINKAIFHDLRRTFCSWAGMSGCTQMELQEMLGHRSPRMTKIYLKFSQSHIADQMEKAQGKILNGTTHDAL